MFLKTFRRPQWLSSIVGSALCAVCIYCSVDFKQESLEGARATNLSFCHIARRHEVWQSGWDTWNNDSYLDLRTTICGQPSKWYTEVPPTFKPTQSRCRRNV